MPTIDLTVPAPAPASALDGAPRRIGLTLPELRLAADLAGGAPLPFDTAPDVATAPIEDRLGASPATSERHAYQRVLDALPEPREALTRRGLLVDGRLDPGVAGAIGLLATPTLALDLDVAVRGAHAKAWHRVARRSGRRAAVAALATADGVVFELAWFGADAWASELSRVAALPEDAPIGSSAVPAYVDLPLELADAAGEALRAGRGEVVAALVARHSGRVHDAAGGELPDATVSQVLAGLATEAHGRLRGLAADLSDGEVATVGVVSWTLVDDGWRALRHHRQGEEDRVEVRAVDPGDLATALAPVLAVAR